METIVVHVSFMIYAISLFVNDKGGENSVLHMCYISKKFCVDICVVIL